MGVSLAFHSIFAVVGIGMPVLMVVAERRYQTTGDAAYLELAKRWGALAVGALVLIPSLYYLFRIFNSRPS
jgi:cytochrome bd-type quinol oxidase subunit 1